jgi:hypothetical protein
LKDLLLKNLFSRRSKETQAYEEASASAWKAEAKKVKTH